MRIILPKHLFLIATILIFSGCQEIPICHEFKQGSFSVRSENMDFDYLITRTGQSQIEKSENGENTYYSIEWLDACSYISKFDDTKMVLTDEMKMVNSDGGIIVELLEVIDDNCIIFQSYVKNYKDMSLRKGKFCKIVE